MQYLTSDGDTADLIAWRQYQSRDGRVTERLLEANPGLADLGPILPAGVSVFLPVIETPAKSEGVRLWT